MAVRFEDIGERLWGTGHLTLKHFCCTILIPFFGVYSTFNSPQAGVEQRSFHI